MSVVQPFKAKPLAHLSNSAAVPNLAILDTAAEVADNANIGDMVRPSDKAGQGTAPDAGTVTITDTPRRKAKGEIEKKTVPQKRLSVDVPAYVLKELNKNSAANEVTIRFIVLDALKKANIRVNEEDLYPDARSV